MRDRLTTAAAIMAIGFAACSSGNSEPPAATDPPTPTITGAGTDTGAALDDVAAAPPDASVPSEPAPAAAPVEIVDTGSIAVSSSAIPAEVATALRSNGGELADTEDWTTRFDPTGIPTIDGPGVNLVEATLTATRTTTGWDRADELQWLFTSTTPRDELLDQMAFDAGIAGQEPTVETSTVDAADCTVRTYTTNDASTVWLVQGCTFEQFPNMVSIGVSRTTTVTVEHGPVGLDPSIASVVDDVDGQIVDVEIFFGAPAAGSTSTLLVAVDLTTTDTNAASTLANGALATWQRNEDEAGLVSFSGSPGSHWNVTASTIRFSHEGRLAP